MHTINKLSPGQLSDEILIAWVARGDTTALETLYDRYAAIVLGICVKIVVDRAIAETVLQETFWQVWQRAASYPAQPRSFISWLFRIARELAKEARKSNRN